MTFEVGMIYRGLTDKVFGRQSFRLILETSDSLGYVKWVGWDCKSMTRTDRHQGYCKLSTLKAWYDGFTSPFLEPKPLARKGDVVEPGVTYHGRGLDGSTWRRVIDVYVQHGVEMVEWTRADQFASCTAPGAHRNTLQEFCVWRAQEHEVDVKRNPVATALDDLVASGDLEAFEDPHVTVINLPLIEPTYNIGDCFTNDVDNFVIVGFTTASGDSRGLLLSLRTMECVEDFEGTIQNLRRVATRLTVECRETNIS